MGQLDRDFGNIMHLLDEEGFLKDPALWSKQIAEQIALHDGMGTLSDTQWNLINSLRDFYLTHGYTPMERHICFINNMDKLCIETLFNLNYLEAWRIAGLPNPGEEYKSYM